MVHIWRGPESGHLICSEHSDHQIQRSPLHHHITMCILHHVYHMWYSPWLRCTPCISCYYMLQVLLGITSNVLLFTICVATNWPLLLINTRFLICRDVVITMISSHDVMVCALADHRREVIIMMMYYLVWSIACIASTTISWCISWCDDVICSTSLDKRSWKGGVSRYTQCI